MKKYLLFCSIKNKKYKGSNLAASTRKIAQRTMPPRTESPAHKIKIAGKE